MPALLYSRRQGAAALVLILGVALIVALTPYATGLVGIPVLYVVFAPLHRRLAARTEKKVAAGLVVALALLLLVALGGFFAGRIVNEAGQIGASLMQSPILARLSELRPGGVDLGARLGDLAAKIVSWIGSSALGLLGSASRLVLNIVISFIGLFYLLLRPQETWDAVRPYIPFSERNTEKLRQRFRDVTASAVIGTGLSAGIVGALVGLALRVAGLPNVVFWGVAAAIFSVLPVVGGGLVWIPGAIALLLDHRPGAAVLLVAWGLVVVGNVDYVVRPMVSRRWAHIHPLVTIVGALVGVPYFGLLGIFIGPLAVSYFFELIKMYREDYLTRVE